MAETIRKKMFVFEDIVSMDNRSIQRFIRECDIKDIVYALKGSDEKIKNLIFQMFLLVWQKVSSRIWKLQSMSVCVM